MQTQVELAIDLGYIEKGFELMDHGWEVARILNGLLSSLRSGVKSNPANQGTHVS